MIFLKIRFTPIRTILGLMLATSIGLTIGYDYRNRTRIEDILLTSIYSSNILVQSNNYQLLSVNLHSLTELNPFVKSLGIYVLGERRTGFGELPEDIQFSKTSPSDLVQISMTGFFTYEARYLFSNTQTLLYGSFAEPNRVWVLLILHLATAFSFALIYWVSTYLDIDRIQEQALNYALSLSGRTLHGLKTHMIHADQIHSILAHSKYPLTEEEKLIVKDFDLSKIEMDGHMSVMKLDSFKGCREEIDLEENLRHLIQVYSRSGISWELHCSHGLKLPVDRDIFTATAGNLIKNAFDYADKQVWITTEKTSHAIRLTVSNRGKVISKERLKNLSKIGITEESGTGLGLHICRAWLKKLGGVLIIESNKGATVAEIEFPLKVSKISLDNKGSAPAELEPSKNTNLQYLKIAIIDDVASFRKKLSDQLISFGAKTEAFETISGFLDQIEKNPLAFHAVIVDRHLRGENAVRDRFPESCRYLGFQGTVILYSCDPSNSKSLTETHGFDLLLPKDEKIDWNSILTKIKEMGSIEV